MSTSTQTRNVIITTVFTVFSLIAFAMVGASAFLPFGAEAHGGRGHFGGASSNNKHDRMLAHCKRLGPAHMRVVEAAISAALDLNDTQEEALQPVITVLDEWRAETVSTCESMKNTQGEAQAPVDIDTGLATMQQMLATSADTLSQLRPAYAAFEDTLNDEQRTHISEMIRSHHGR